MIDKYKRLLQQAIGKKELLQKMSKENDDKLFKLCNDQIHTEEAQIVFQKVAQQTQSKLKYHIEDIVQMSLDLCFPDEYVFHIEFVTKRGKTEADLFLTKNGNRIDPLDADGGGVVNIVTLGLRISTLTLGKSDKILVLDEPLKDLSKDFLEKGIEIIKQLSDKLGIQFIIVTHETQLTETADRVFTVTQQDFVSSVKTT